MRLPEFLAKLRETAGPGWIVTPDGKLRYDTANRYACPLTVLTDISMDVSAHLTVLGISQKLHDCIVDAADGMYIAPHGKVRYRLTELRRRLLAAINVKEGVQ